ncbi:multicopper oxidase domain-containing protein [Streptomyces nodosus]
MDRRSFNRRMLLGGAAAATAWSVGPEDIRPAKKVRTAPLGGKVRHIKVFAESLGDGQMGYGFAKGRATIPGPLIELNEGDTLHIEFTNTTDAPTSLHVHGLDYEIADDGTRPTGGAVEPGGKRTYTWRTHVPGRREDGTWREGSAGYWHYHDHVLGSEHGSRGVHAGLYGPVIVRRAGDVLPGRTYTIVFNNMMINNHKPHGGRGRHRRRHAMPQGHHGPSFEATVGDRVEFVMITHGSDYHTFHMHGHRWADNRTGILDGPEDHSAIIDNRIVGPGDSFGFQVIAGEGVGAGAWMYHCHVQRHADLGMAGLFLVKGKDGKVPLHQPGVM